MAIITVAQYLFVGIGQLSVTFKNRYKQDFLPFLQNLFTNVANPDDI